MITPKKRVRADGTISWRVSYRVGGRGTTQTSRTFATPEAAAAFARLIEDVGAASAERVLAASAPTATTVPTLKAWIDSYIATRSGVGATTLEDYRHVSDSQLDFLARMPITAITPDDIASWINRQAAKTTRLGAPTSGKTIANRHGLISAAMKKAVRDGVIASNPCAGSRLPRSVVEPMTILTHGEYVDFITCFAPHWRPLAATLFATGLRFGEATALTVGDVRDGSLTVTKSWRRDGTLGPLKTRKSRRTIALADATVEALRPLMAKRRADSLIFTNTVGNRVLHSPFNMAVWQKALDKANDAGMDKRPRIHDARHTFASWLLNAGVPINVVQYQLGHESITTTVDRYGHLLPQAQDYVRTAIAAALAPPTVVNIGMIEAVDDLNPST